MPAANAPNAAEAAMKAEAARLAAEAQAAAAKEPQPPPPGSSSAPGTPEFDAAMTANVIVTLVDLVLATFVSQKLKLADAEAQAIIAKAEPVVRMYLPPELFLGPVGALAVTAGGIYAAKLMADPVPPPSTQTVDSTATPVPPVAPTPAGAPGVPT